MEFSESTRNALKELSISYNQDPPSQNDDDDENDGDAKDQKENGDNIIVHEGVDEDDEDIQQIFMENYSFRLKIPEAEWNVEKKTLFATMIWNAAKYLGNYLMKQAQDKIHGKTVLEFGAAVGLPSFICNAIGAQLVCVSDYPTDHIISVIEENINLNQKYQSEDHRMCAIGYKWGTDVTPLLERNNNQQYDLILASECLWRHEQHDELLFSISSALSSTGTAIIAFSHHVPGKEQNDLAFFTLATTKYHLQVVKMTSSKRPHMWTEKFVDIFIYELQKEQELHDQMIASPPLKSVA